QFAGQSPTITWWPSDHLDSHLRSIDAWRRHEGRDNVQAPVRLDASAPDWKLAAHGLPSSFTAMVCANVIHIAPWRVTEGILSGARGRQRIAAPEHLDVRVASVEGGIETDRLGAIEPAGELRGLASRGGLPAGSRARAERLDEMSAGLDGRRGIRDVEQVTAG